MQELESLSAGRRVAVFGHDGNPPLVALAGPSGVGKSSLVRAGVIPLLKRSGEGWDTFILRPGRRPLVSLSAILVKLARAATDPVATTSETGTGEHATGTYAWPEDLAYYVERYHVALPPEFLAHLAAAKWTAPADIDTSMIELG